MAKDEPEHLVDQGGRTAAGGLSRRGPVRPIVLAGAALTGVVLVGVVSVVIGIDPVDREPAADAPETAVELPPAAELEPLAEAQASELPSTLSCEPEGCVEWWTDRIDHRPTVVHDGYLVHVGRDALQGLDVRSGATLWQQSHPPEWGQAVNSVAPLVDDRGVVIAHGNHLWFRDLATGELRAETRLDEIYLQEIERVPGGVLAVAWDAPIPPAEVVLLYIDEAGDVVWRRTIERQVGVVGADDDALDAVALVVDDEHLFALRLDDGTPQWWLDLDHAFAFLHGDQVVRFAPEGTSVEVLGNVAVAYPARPVVEHRWSFDDEVAWVQPLGALLLVVAGDRAHLVDPADGREVAVRRLGDDRWAADAVERGDRTVVLWSARPGEEHHDLEVYEPELGLVRAVEVARTEELDEPHGQVHALGDGVVRVVLAGRQVADVNIDTGEPTGLGFTVGDDIIDLTVHGDLVRLRQPGATSILGVDGTVSVVGASGIASVDPLIVHGGAGAMRIDRELLVRP